MDEMSFPEVGMEGGQGHKLLLLGPGPSNLPALYGFTKRTENKTIIQFHQSPESALEMKEMDTADYDMDVSISNAKCQSDNLRLKQNIPKLLEADMHMDCDNGLDIPKNLATKKVVLPEETKDEEAAVLDQSLNVQHKKQSHKRTLTQASDLNDSYTLHPEILKITEYTIQWINTNSDPKYQVCVSYDRKQFSSVDNLEDVTGNKVTGGTFGDVRKMWDSKTHNYLMQKQMKDSEGKFKIEKNEIEVPLQFTDQENIARFFGFSFKCGKLLYFLEDAGISLRQVVTDEKMRHKLLEPGRIEKIMLGMYTALSHLARHQIVHCDIKPENVCLNVITWVVKFIDFGSCKTPQDNIDFKGTTPEYLDPTVNKFLYECLVLKNRRYPVHKLDELDDVFGAGLVGLFLYKTKHPLIYFFTGRDSVGDLKTRYALMKKISELTEEQMCQLLAEPMSDIMRGLFQGVLALDRNKRWTAIKAVTYLQEKLGSVVQPPNKLCRLEPQPYRTQAEDMSMFVNLHQKNSDTAVVQRTQKCESSGSPDISQTLMGINMKAPDASAQTGMILLPKKLSSKPQIPPLQQQSPQLLYPGQMRSAVALPNMNDRESQEYKDLVMSFSEKTQMCQDHSLHQKTDYFPGMQKSDRQNFQVLPEYAGGSQRMMFQNLRAEQPVHGGQLMASPSPILGLSGSRLFHVAEKFHLNPPAEMCGNVPIFEKLISGEEHYRPKLRGRRGHGSQEEK